jgi:uncharacterized protein
MRIAIIGSGIAGLGAALALNEENEVRLFEKSPRFGGHSHTVDVAFGERRVQVDVGFIVYNEGNYPNLCGLFEHLGVETTWSDMSFGFSLHDGRMEWAGDSLDTVFAQRRNALNPRFVRGVFEILRFNRLAREHLAADRLRGVSLGDWLEQERFSAWFRDCYILPMGGAIWSTPLGRMLDFPMENFAAFFDNHDLLKGMSERRRWRTVVGGSREYVARAIDRLGGGARAATEVVRIERAGGRPKLRFADGSEAVFDEVVLACHAPEAAALIGDLDARERGVLAGFRTSSNRVVLHSDPSLMPRRRKVWSSWNFLSGGPEADAERPTPVTYWMQRLQGVDPACPLFVSLNPSREPDPASVHAELSCAHPVMDHAAFAAQRAIGSIQGRGGIWYAGAWLGYGFHEDGLRSGLAVAAALGAEPAWARAMPPPAAVRVAEAAA